MRIRVLNYLKTHPMLLESLWVVARLVLSFISSFIVIKKKRIVFCSFGGRSFSDSPRYLYEAITNNPYFDDWDLTWAFINPSAYDFSRATTVRIDSPSFFWKLITSKVWISNSGMDRDIGINTRNIIKIETWHGIPLKKIGGEENTGSMIAKNSLKDNGAIRCAQSEYDLEIFSRVFNTPKDNILMSDLPRNDILVAGVDTEYLDNIKHNLHIPLDKKVILYMPTYREYLLDNDLNYYIAPPLSIEKWKKELGSSYILLIRAHYAITKALNICDDFVVDVSSYDNVNDLYFISDLMISDYSSAFFDYSLLNKPFYCYAYDYDEYVRKRGLYLDLDNTLPCKVDYTEDDLLKHLSDPNYDMEALKKFRNKYLPVAGNSTNMIVDYLITTLSE